MPTSHHTDVLDPVAIYARQSDPNKKAEQGMDRSLSLTTQIDEAAKVADRLGSKTRHTYAEQITSEVWEHRPELSRLIDDIDRLKIKAIIVYKYNRIARDPNQQTIFVQLMEAKGVRVISCMEGELPAGPIGHMIHYIYGTISKIEKQNIIQNTIKTKRRLQEEGKLLCQGKPCYGYRYDRKLRIRVIVVEEAKVIVRIYHMVLQGKSLRQIAKILNLEGIPGPAGGPKASAYFYDDWVDFAGWRPAARPVIPSTTN